MFLADIFWLTKQEKALTEPYYSVHSTVSPIYTWNNAVIHLSNHFALTTSYSMCYSYECSSLLLWSPLPIPKPTADAFGGRVDPKWLTSHLQGPTYKENSHLHTIWSHPFTFHSNACLWTVGGSRKRTQTVWKCKLHTSPEPSCSEATELTTAPPCCPFATVNLWICESELSLYFTRAEIYFNLKRVTWFLFLLFVSLFLFNFFLFSRKE